MYRLLTILLVRKADSLRVSEKLFEYLGDTVRPWLGDSTTLAMGYLCNLPKRLMAGHLTDKQDSHNSLLGANDLHIWFIRTPQ